MASAFKNLSDHDPSQIPDGSNYYVSVVVSEYYADITNALLAGCLDTLLTNGVPTEHINISYVPGTFELPQGADIVLRRHTANFLQPHALICLGCVITGETKHDEYINHAVAQGLTHLAISYHKPVIYGVLTPLNHQQALDRAGGKHGNKGVEAAITALKMLSLETQFG